MTSYQLWFSKKKFLKNAKIPCKIGTSQDLAIFAKSRIWFSTECHNFQFAAIFGLSDWLNWLIWVQFFFFGLYITLCSKRRMNMPCIYACCIQYKSIYAPLPQSQQKIHWLVIFPQDSYHMYIYILTYLCTCIWLEDPFYDVFRFFFTWLDVQFFTFCYK